MLRQRFIFPPFINFSLFAVVFLRLFHCVLMRFFIYLLDLFIIFLRFKDSSLGDNKFKRVVYAEGLKKYNGKTGISQFGPILRTALSESFR